MNSFQRFCSQGMRLMQATVQGVAVLGIVLPAVGVELHVPKGTWPGHARGYVGTMVVSSNYAYLAEFEGGLQILDVSNPANPQWVGSYEAVRTVQGLAVSGKYAYLACQWEGLHIVDVSNPAKPQRIASDKHSCSATYGVALAGNYAYVVEGPCGLRVLDVSNPASPRWSGTYDTDYAYVTCHDQGLQVFDMTYPANPKRIGAYDTHYARNLVISGNYAYVADGFAGLQVVHLDLVTHRTVPFVVSGTPGQTVRLQRSRNLVAWEDWQDVVLLSGVYEFADQDAGAEALRFYRAVEH